MLSSMERGSKKESGRFLATPALGEGLRPSPQFGI